MIPGSREPSVPEAAGHRHDVDVYSPDRSVRVAASSRGDIAVEVDGLHRHTDESLARQVRAAARIALASLQRPTREMDAPTPQRRSGW